MINRCTINGTDIPIVYDSFHYNAQFGYKGAFRFGAVSGESIEFDFFNDGAPTINVGDIIRYQQKVYVTDDFREISIPQFLEVGYFYVQQINFGDKQTHVIAYDSVCLLNVDFSKRLKELESSFPMKLYELVAEACSVAGVSSSMGRDDIQSLSAIKNYEIGYFFSDGITVRDIFKYAAEMLLYRAVKSGSQATYIEGYDFSSTVSYWKTPDSYIIAPDDADYHNNNKYKYNVWYKENSLSKKETVSQYDAVRIVSTSGEILGEYDNVVSPQRIYYITGNLLIDNIVSMGSDTFNDYAYKVFGESNPQNSIYSGGNLTPTKVSVFPFRMPFFPGNFVHLVDKSGTITHFPIMSLNLSESEVVLEGYGKDDDDSEYGTSYKTANDGQTMLSSQINALFTSVDGIVSNLKYNIYNSVEDIGLESGNATIASAWTALPDGSILYAPHSDFPTAQLPGNYLGIVEIIKNQNGKGAIYFHGQTDAYGEGKMSLSNATPPVPSGTWENLRTLNNIASGSSNLIDISGYTSSNMYTFPEDGYVFVSNSGSQTGYVLLVGAGQTTAYVRVGYGTGYFSCFVKKGMKCYASGTSGTMRFAKLS